MTRRQQLDRVQRAILTALAQQGNLTVRELRTEVVKLGPDAPKIPPAVQKMLRAKLIALAPNQRHGAPLLDLRVSLPH